MHSGDFDFTLPSQCVDTNMTLDAAKWNGGVDELSSCVRNNILLDHES